MRVTCGHLGFPDAVKNSKQSVQSNLVEAFLLNNVNCLGNESSLFSCDHGGFHEQQCSSGQAVWLKCKVFNRNNQFKNVSLNKYCTLIITSKQELTLENISQICKIELRL